MARDGGQGEGGVGGRSGTVRMEGYEKKWRSCIEEDWTEWIGSKTLDSVGYYI